MNNFFVHLLNFREWLGNYISPYLGWLKFFGFIFLSFFCIGIVYAVLKAEFVNDKIEQFMDLLKLGDIRRHRLLRIWRKANKKLRLGDKDNLKAAVIEADKILDELLKIRDVAGKNLDERLAQLDQKQFPFLEEIWPAHKICIRLKKELDFELTKEEAERIISIYKKAFAELGLL